MEIQKDNAANYHTLNKQYFVCKGAARFAFVSSVYKLPSFCAGTPTICLCYALTKKLTLRPPDWTVIIERKNYIGGDNMGAEGEKLLSISQMAELHGVTRQRLIYYDKIGLFRPACVGENGYRRYAPSQIPFLREICYLRSVGVPLEDIGAHIRHRSPDTAIDLLTAHRGGELERHIGELAAARDRISQRTEQYESARVGGRTAMVPELRTLGERWALFRPWAGEACREMLHMGVMALREEAGAADSGQFGSLLGAEGAGCCVFLTEKRPGARRLVAGDYACMYKYGMPYEQVYLDHLRSWVRAQGYESTGDAVDLCLLDRTFYGSGATVDFCQLQIPVQKFSLTV